MEREEWITVLGRESVVVTTKADAQESIRRRYISRVAPSSSSWRAAIISDSGVPPSLVDRVVKGATSPTCPPPPVYILPCGEGSKSRVRKENIENWLLSQSFGRDTIIIAVGGGMVGDIAGFVAATYLRGVPVVHVPTTLMSMVDSSVGGKTAVNVDRYGKNLIGAFHQPVLVLMDLHCLSTLPRRVVIEAFAEVLKYDAIDFASRSPGFAPTRVSTMADFATASQCECWDSDTQRPESYFCHDGWFDLVRSCAKAKAAMVSADERESGLRELLNFGHTVGHAVEAVMGSPMCSGGPLFHGECVAIGMVAELEVSQALGHATYQAVWQLRDVLRQCGLPTEIPDAAAQRPSELIRMMKGDKKNRDSNIHLILLSAVGVPAVESRQKSSPVDEGVLWRVCSRGVIPSWPLAAGPPQQPHPRIIVPGSKSLTNRTLLLLATSRSTPVIIRGALIADDTLLMIVALELLGVAHFRLGGSGDIRIEPISPKATTLTNTVLDKKRMFVGNSGTTARFVLPLCAILPPAITGCREIELWGSARMSERPIAPLVGSLRRAGAAISFLATSAPDSLPLKVVCGSLHCAAGETTTFAVNAETSSQFLSALLLCAPAMWRFACAGNGGQDTPPASPPKRHGVMVSTASSQLVSRPFVVLTVELMRTHGVLVEERQTSLASGESAWTFVVQEEIKEDLTDETRIEGDATNASYMAAIGALCATPVYLDGIAVATMKQGDRFFFAVLERFGVSVEQGKDATIVNGRANNAETLQGLGLANLGDVTDCFMTVAVVAAVASGETIITGIANQRVKECDRIAAVATALASIGVSVEELADGLKIVGNPSLLLPARDDASGVKVLPTIECYSDHRMAMSFACLALAISKSSQQTRQLPIGDWRCVDKTYPAFWDDLSTHFGVLLEPIERKQSPSKENGCAVASGGDIVCLIGMRYSGKTTIGRALASANGWHFVDIDEVVQARAGGRSPRDVVANHGWDVFREMEHSAMELTLQAAECRAPGQVTVIACGGGFVDHCASIDLLKQTKQAFCERRTASFCTIWLDKPLEQVEACHAADLAGRPAYNASVAEVHQRRRPLFAALCDVRLFVRPSSSIEDTQKIVSQRIIARRHFMALTTAPAPTHGFEYSHFVCITLPSADEVSNDLVRDVSFGCDAVEVRMDALTDKTTQAMKCLFDAVCSATAQPVIATFRTADEGGNSSHQLSGDGYWEIADILIRDCGAGVIDLQFRQWCSASERQRQQLLEQTRSISVILSLHSNSVDEIVQLGPTLLREAEQRCWLPKIVLMDPEDTLSALRLKHDLLSATRAGRQPLIYVATGPSGQAVRAVNQVMTPVTHPRLAAAAPGQLTLRDLNALRMGLRMSPSSVPGSAAHYLFGAPIKHSLSPAIHNKVFELLGWDHCTYELHETSVAADAVAFMRSALEAARLRGASVTIPLKETIIPHLDHVDDDAACIGAVNTIVSRFDNVMQLMGLNTDWLALRDALLATPMGMNLARNGGPSVHVVVGAGGTARSAAFTILKTLPLAHVILVNRTAARAHQLRDSLANTMNHFGQTPSVDRRLHVGWAAIDRLKDTIDPWSISSFIGTVPPHAAIPLDDADIQMLHTVFQAQQQGSQLPVVAVDFSYSGNSTPESTFARAVRLVAGGTECTWIEGRDILKRQAMHQQQLWLNADRFRHPADPSKMGELNTTGHCAIMRTSCGPALMFPVTSHLDGI